MPLHVTGKEENFDGLVGTLGALIQHLFSPLLSVAVFEVLSKTLSV